MCMQETINFRVIEFYSGIGGLFYGLVEGLKNCMGKNAAVDFIQCHDVNKNACAVHCLNFPEVPCITKSLDDVTIEELDGASDIWLLSPPCQPYLKHGKHLDEKDPRSSSFIHLIRKVLPGLQHPPRMLFFENVPTFKDSNVHGMMVETLKEMSYEVYEYNKSPQECGYPNSRSRYYACAWKTDGDLPGQLSASILPRPHPEDSRYPLVPFSKILEPRLLLVSQDVLGGLGEVADGNMGGEGDIGAEDKAVFEMASPLIVPRRVIARMKSFRWDVVNLHSKTSTTFTKAYGESIGRSGPVIDMNDHGGDPPPSQFQLLDHSTALVRHFHPDEMIKLHGFPESFQFPPTLSIRQRFALIGNSLHVTVFAEVVWQSLDRISKSHTGG
eukprot:GHVO01016472.1.p1 GENE.GHVO01016472.1~~GHVO01016472.1.p1  ORF type:complete len:385 (+),score=73.51 GHVO01016472.1:423-1577(+)